jgi:hypothetical protein
MNRRSGIIALALLLAALTLPAPPQGKAAPKATEEEKASLMEQERLGDLRTGLSGTEAQKAISCPAQKGKEVLEGATGDFVQTWRFPGCGVELKMASEKKGGVKTVAAITVTAPCTLRTKQGIGIGSTEAEVIQAYARYNDEDGTQKGRCFVAGSIYGGVIFTFTGGKVSKIFIGAAAE